ncbi:solute carrier family 25 member 35 isoform X2 [Bubalus kerabau]|uniref:solute carrier family 25 member 35 isoform X2 n=1 Tax=Bubalus bubalis TaxID=89462 RepID=UPI00042CF62D|nr:solute carrier family 25 member 35 isoform X2 [Bubalus bubalis]XP_055432562.1 solute carrier family 25 member 35 isoform X2 [Bubalus carabanensis]
MDFLMSGLAACGACLFTNPLEVVKTRMQLQGELRAPGTYQRHYRNVFHAFITIGKVDGLAALQKGLAPALLYQFLMNGIRLGTYGLAEAGGYLHTAEGTLNPVRSAAAGALAGVMGAYLGSPIYMVKTHLQAQAATEIAVGHQYNHQIFPPQSWKVALAAAMVSGIAVVLAMTPFDVVSTRLYNQPTDAQGKGLMYRGLLDALLQTARTEGIFGMYKGIGASYFRLGPHTILSLFFWDQLRMVYYTYTK